MAGAVRQGTGLSRSLAGMAGCLVPGRPTAPNPVPIHPARAVHARTAAQIQQQPSPGWSVPSCGPPGWLRRRL